jgi:NADH:ubiquinone oxidoreductase subunit E
MARYPDFRSAAIPALHAAQRLHGWCSPTAIEQVACVMRLTPGYLTAVATFYDMFDTTPRGGTTCTCARTSRARCAGRTSSTRPCCRAAGDDPDFHVKSFECLGACDIAPMISSTASTSARWCPRDCDQIVADVKPAAPCWRPSSCATARGGQRAQPEPPPTPDRAASGPTASHNEVEGRRRATRP